MKSLSKPKNRVGENDFAVHIDELNKAFPKPESTVVKEESTLDSAGELNKSVVGEPLSKVEGVMKLASQKEHGGKLFSRKKTVKALEPTVDMQGTLPKKKSLSLKFSPFKKKNELTVPFTPIPELAAADPKPVNEKVLETYSLLNLIAV